MIPDRKGVHPDTLCDTGRSQPKDGGRTIEGDADDWRLTERRHIRCPCELNGHVALGEGLLSVPSSASRKQGEQQQVKQFECLHDLPPMNNTDVVLFCSVALQVLPAGHPKFTGSMRS